VYTQAENNAQALELARKCLSADGPQMEPLLVYSFQSDVDAHDDVLQNRLITEFEEEWRKASVELAREFGAAVTAESCEETEYVPLNGVGGASSWQVAGKRLYVAYAHEDRETPYLLIVGTLI
jgi:hypothetical protein